MLPVIHSDLLIIGLLWGKTSCQIDKLNFQGQTDRQRTKTYIAACLSLRYPKGFIDGSIVFRLLIKMFRAPRQNVGFVKIWKKYIEESSPRSMQLFIVAGQAQKTPALLDSQIEFAYRLKGDRTC